MVGRRAGRGRRGEGKGRGGSRGRGKSGVLVWLRLLPFCAGLIGGRAVGIVPCKLPRYGTVCRRYAPGKGGMDPGGKRFVL